MDVCCGNTVCASTQGVSKVSRSIMRCRLTKNVNVRENAAIFYANQMTNEVLQVGLFFWHFSLRLQNQLYLAKTLSFLKKNIIYLDIFVLNFFYKICILWDNKQIVSVGKFFNFLRVLEFFKNCLKGQITKLEKIVSNLF